LGHYLIKNVYLMVPSLSGMLEDAFNAKRRVGETAVVNEFLDEDALSHLIQEQSVETLSYSLKNDFEARPFVASPESFYMPAGIEMNHLILFLARANLEPFKVDPNRPIMLQDGQRLSHLPWYPQELSVLSALNEPRTLQDLAALTGIEYSRLAKILSVLNSLRLIAVVEESPHESTALVKRAAFPFEALTPEIPQSCLDEKLVVLRDEGSFASEQFKTLKVQIARASAHRPVCVLAVSSPQSTEGKSLISTNLAASLSKDPDRHTILVDCDFRNPSLHRLLGCSIEPGVQGYLETDYLQPYCYLRRLDRLYFMAAGGITSNPVELLAGEKMRRLIEFLRTEFNTVVLDCPPMAPVSDTQILATLSDALILVVRSGRTSFNSIERAFKSVDRNKFLGLVLNDVQPMPFHTQDRYKYYHYKSKGIYPYAAAKKKIVARPRNYLDL